MKSWSHNQPREGQPPACPKIEPRGIHTVRPHHAMRRRRFAAEKWDMPEDAPPKKS
jgi:hypothetical protein